MSEGAASATPDGRKPPAGRARRIFALFVSIVAVATVAAAVTAWLAASDILARLLRQQALASGLELDVGRTEVGRGWAFTLDDVVVRDSAGDEIVRAARVSGSPRFGWTRPHLRIALSVRDGRLVGEAGASPFEILASPALLRLPELVSRVELEGFHVDLGEGASVDLAASLTGGEDGSVDVEIVRFDHSDEASGFAAEKLVGALRLEHVVMEERAWLRVRVRVAAGAALVGAVLVDFSSHPVEGEALVAVDGTFLDVRDLDAGLGGLMRAGGTLRLAPDGSLDSGDLRIGSDDLAKSFASFVREPFGGVAPSIEEAEIEGRGEASLRFAKPTQAALEARVKLVSPSLSTRSLEVRGIDIDVPWRGASLAAGRTERGRLRASSLTLLGLPWGALDVGLEASPGRVRATAPLVLRAFGGSLRVEELQFEDTKAAGPRLGGKLTLEGLDVGLLASSFGFEGIAGTVSGDLGHVTFDPARVEAQGTIHAALFGGSVDFSGMFVEDPFGRVPTVGVDAEVRDLDLEKLTAALPFGSVRGILEGRVSNLRVAAGQPVSFEADLHTVRRRGIDQTIDVRAINQLGVLGGGDQGSLTGTLLSVFDRYRYSAMGIRCRLHNDLFDLRGVESEGGRDYLVRGGLWPPTVNVVSHSQVVSFSEMLRRVERMTALGEGESRDASPR